MIFVLSLMAILLVWQLAAMLNRYRRMKREKKEVVFELE